MKNRKIVCIAIVALLATLIGAGCYRTEAPPDPRTAAQKVEGEWFNQRARDLQGNFDQLSADEKARAIAFSHDNERNARAGFGMAAHSKPKQ